MLKKKLESFARKYWLKQGNNQKNIQVEIIDGNSSPHIIGHTFHYKTKSGKLIYHPSAYSNKGWSNMIYCSSTRRLCVGKEWLLSHPEIEKICWLSFGENNDR